MMNQPDRLDRIEVILDRMAADNDRRQADNDRRQAQYDRWHEEAQHRMAAMEQQQQALSRDIAQMVATHQECVRHTDELMTRLGEIQVGMGRWMTSIDETQPTILAELTRIENKVDTILQRE